MEQTEKTEENASHRIVGFPSNRIDRIPGWKESKILSVLPRIRYSRWALLAGIAAVLCAANWIVLFTVDLSPGYRWVNRNVANRDLAEGLLLTSAMGWAPLCLVLSSLALRQIRSNPDLRGKWIARLAILVGIPGTAYFLLVIVVLVWGNLLKKF
jgi:hypothetical protein